MAWETRTGYIDWIGSDGTGGRELFTGNFQKQTSQLSISGTNVLFSKDIVSGNYTVQLFSDGSDLINGSWGSQENEVVPETWKATRIELK